MEYHRQNWEIQKYVIDCVKIFEHSNDKNKILDILWTFSVDELMVYLEEPYIYNMCKVLGVKFQYNNSCETLLDKCIELSLQHKNKSNV